MPVTLTSGKSSCNLLNITEAELPRADVKNLSKAEMLSLFETHGLAIEKCETTEMPQRLENWLALTRTPEPIQRKIKERMRSELAGGEKNRLFSLCGEWNHLFQPKMAAADGKKAVAKPAWPAAVQMNATYPPPAFASRECPDSLLD